MNTSETANKLTRLAAMKVAETKAAAVVAKLAAAKKLAVLQADIAVLETEIKADVVEYGETIRGIGKTGVYYNGKESVNLAALRAWAAENNVLAEVETFIKMGMPYASIR